jgi:hypothetical protein
LPVKVTGDLHHPAYLNNVINFRSIGITPQTVMFDDQQIMEEPLRRINSIQMASKEQHILLQMHSSMPLCQLTTLYREGVALLSTTTKLG